MQVSICCQHHSRNHPCMSTMSCAQECQHLALIVWEQYRFNFIDLFYCYIINMYFCSLKLHLTLKKKLSKHLRMETSTKLTRTPFQAMCKSVRKSTADTRSSQEIYQEWSTGKLFEASFNSLVTSKDRDLKETWYCTQQNCLLLCMWLYHIELMKQPESWSLKFT